MLKDEPSCQDILQDVFITLWRQAPKLKEDTNIAAYLYKLTRNRVLNSLAKDKLHGEHLIHFTRFIESQPVIPDELLREKELIAIMESELINLPDKMREVFELSRINQLSHQEIADQLNISTNTVKSQISNVLRRLRKRFNFFFMLFL